MIELATWVTITDVLANGMITLALVLMCYMLYHIWKDW